MSLFWCPIHRWESIQTDCPQCVKEKVVSTGPSYVDRIETKLDKIVQLLTIIASKEKNPTK